MESVPCNMKINTLAFQAAELGNVRMWLSRGSLDSKVGTVSDFTGGKLREGSTV